jgi:hypothetical protein
VHCCDHTGQAPLLCRSNCGRGGKAGSLCLHTAQCGLVHQAGAQLRQRVAVLPAANHHYTLAVFCAPLLVYHYVPCSIVDQAKEGPGHQQPGPLLSMTLMRSTSKRPASVRACGISAVKRYASQGSGRRHVVLPSQPPGSPAGGQQLAALPALPRHLPPHLLERQLVQPQRPVRHVHRALGHSRDATR